MSEPAELMLHELRGFLGTSCVYTMEQIPEPPETVADATQKFVLRSGRAAHFIWIVSNATSPLLVRRNVERMQMAKSRLSNDLGSVIELPVLQGVYEGRSYALWRMRTPLSSNRLLLAVQKLMIAPVMVRWLCDVASETSHYGDATQFAASTERLLSVSGLSETIRASAQVCRLGFLSGEIAPVSVLQHGDLWIGNVLKTPTDKGFMIIDWAGATLDGFPFFDLASFVFSVGASARTSRRFMEDYSRAVHCAMGMAMPYVLAGLGRLHQELEHFPERRFIELCEQMVAAIRLCA